jgi:hypothetical protein
MHNSIIQVEPFLIRSYYNLTNLKQCICYLRSWSRHVTTFLRQHSMFRTHPDINLARMTFNHQLSIESQVCTPEHFNLQYTQLEYEGLLIVRSLVFGL